MNNFLLTIYLLCTKIDFASPKFGNLLDTTTLKPRILSIDKRAWNPTYRPSVIIFIVYCTALRSCLLPTLLTIKITPRGSGVHCLVQLRLMNSYVLQSNQQRQVIQEHLVNCATYTCYTRRSTLLLPSSVIYHQKFETSYYCN